MPCAADTSTNGGSNDNEDGDNNANDALPRPVPRHPFIDGLVVVRRRRFFFASVAHGPGAVVEHATVMF